MFKLNVGDSFPEFDALIGLEQKFEMQNFFGKWVVVFFYPKDNTKGCTIGVNGFKDLYSEFQKHNAEVIGISVDSLKSHAKFSKKYELPFPLISDENKELVNKLEIYRENLFGNASGQSVDQSERKS